MVQSGLRRTVWCVVSVYRGCQGVGCGLEVGLRFIWLEWARDGSRFARWPTHVAMRPRHEWGTRHRITHRALSWGELMFIYKRVFAVLAILVCTATGFAQRSARGGAFSRSVRFNIVVTTAAGGCVTDLQERDFKVFDNNVNQPIAFFRVGPISLEGVEIPHLVYAAGAAFNGCFAPSEVFRYEITFNVPSDARLNEYRQVEIKVDRPNLVVQTGQGYYAQF